MSIKLSVIVPVYNEGSSLAAALEEIDKEVANLDCSYEIIVIDDGSEDNTWETIEESAKKISSLSAIKLSRWFGKEFALCAGLERASGDAVVVMDGDLQHPPELIAQMYTAWEKEGYDIVEAVKSHRGNEGLGSKLKAKMFYLILRRLSGVDLENASDFKLLDRKVLDAWASMPERNVFFRGMSAWLGFKRKQIPFVVPERKAGSSSWTTYSLSRLALRGITSFSTVPIHLITTMGFSFLVLSLILGVIAVYHKATGYAFTGFTTVIILLLIIGSMLMTALGIIGEYISKIYDEVKGRPRYVIAETIGAKE